MLSGADAGGPLWYKTHLLQQTFDIKSWLCSNVQSGGKELGSILNIEAGVVGGRGGGRVWESRGGNFAKDVGEGGEVVVGKVSAVVCPAGWRELAWSRWSAGIQVSDGLMF